ncbi:FkbM family methyltransferase [Chryseobacterium defluvii]|uniref:FkbM family methyltransferase n=1 Tax=Chryseobacterium defluvii TaxID=160396 RepID=A0A840KAG1_9FLAO|nr:FkbM family methyltransferase [Chryseobacterium defluvii]MBB4806186.1 FkbM family methyltransferase [Chryseobacterium defluvii]
MITRLKTKVNAFLGKITYLKKNISIDHQWFGNQYGGFYIASGKLNKDSVVYSFGIGEDISFDKAVIEKFGCKVFAFDPTPKSIKWVKNNTDVPTEFNFFPFGIDDRSGDVEFMLPKNESYVSGSAIKQKNVNEQRVVKVPMKCLSDIVQDLGHTSVDLLKMDIEGSEYKIIENILNTPVEIKQLLIEIHERFFEDGKDRTRKLLSLLEEHGYKLFGVSDSMEELSFIKVK